MHRIKIPGYSDGNSTIPGFWNVSLRVLPNIAQIAALFNKKLRDGPLQTFEGLIDIGITVLETFKVRWLDPWKAFEHWQGAYRVDEDACDMEVGCVLLQNHPDGTYWQIGYWPCLLDDSARAYDTTHCKFLAVVWAVSLFRLYLRGSRYSVRTGHNVLRGILNLTGATWILPHWRLRLSEIESDMVHFAVISQAEDALSRWKTTKRIRRRLRTKYGYSASRPPTPRKKKGESYLYARLRRIKPH